MLQQTKAFTMATFWVSCIWCLAITASGVSTAGIKQLYNTGYPKLLGGSWCSYPHKPEGANKLKESVAITNKLRSIQHKVAISSQVVLAPLQVTSSTFMHSFYPSNFSSASSCLELHSDSVPFHQHTLSTCCCFQQPTAKSNTPSPH
jgi:hypothetical protein